MLIVRFQGGLGNQMFQYAFFKELRTKRQDIKVDLTLYDRKIDERKYELKEVFGIELKEASRKEIFHLSGGERNRFEGFIRQYFKYKTIFREENIGGLDDITRLREGYLDGYWQGECWFPSVQNEIRNEFVFMNQNREDNSFYKEIVGCNSVSIHIRMGDYLENTRLYGNICTREYYRKGIEKIKEYISNPVYFIFSDEPKKAAELLYEIDIEKRFVMKQKKDSDDMWLMSCCRHNIIANSSFSWWGTWLNRHEDKIVISPSRWNGANYDTRIFCKGWILI